MSTNTLTLPIYLYNGNSVNDVDNDTVVFCNYFRNNEIPVSLGAIEIGGYNGNVSNKIDVYNPETNQWEYQYVMPFSVSANATAVYGDKIFIISDFTEMTRIIVFDTVDLSYTSVENNMINRRHFDAEIFNDELYVICGNYTSSLYESGLRSLQAASVGELLSLKNTSNHNFTIYPNPTISIINIEQDFTTAKVYDISGRELLKSTSKTIDLSRGYATRSRTCLVLSMKRF